MRSLRFLLLSLVLATVAMPVAGVLPCYFCELYPVGGCRIDQWGGGPDGNYYARCHSSQICGPDGCLSLCNAWGACYNWETVVITG